MRGEFSVYQFFPDETYIEEKRFVSDVEAFGAFKHLTTNVAAQNGLVERVIIIDGWDNICAEWQKGKGIVFPPPPQEEKK